MGLCCCEWNSRYRPPVTVTILGSVLTHATAAQDLDGALSEERIRSADARAVVRNKFVYPARPTNGIEPPKLAKPAYDPEKRGPFLPTALAPGKSQSPGPFPPAMYAPSGYTTTLVPTYYYPGWAMLYVPIRNNARICEYMSMLLLDIADLGSRTKHQ